MEYRQLGKTDLKLSVVGFGTATLGDLYGGIDPEEATRAVHLAVDSGLTFFDSSPYYGITLAEKRLGTALAGRRDKVTISTKCGRYGKDDFDFSAKRIIASMDESLQRLQTDYIDLFLAHDVEFGDAQQVIDETIPALRQLQQQGKARYVGITGYPPKLLRRIAEKAPVDAILTYCHYNLMNTDMDGVLTEFCRSEGIGLINASALAMGLLTESGGPSWHPASQAVKDAAKKAAAFCRAQGADISELAMRFSLDHSFVSSTLIGMSTVKEVQAGLALLKIATDKKLLAEVEEIFAPVYNYVWPSGRPENQT